MAVFFRNKRIASYIRTGLTLNAEESESHWLEFSDAKDDYGYKACALGLAITGKLGLWKGHRTFVENSIKNYGDQIKTISEILEIEPLLTEEINKAHMMGFRAVEIAESLEFEPSNDQLDLPITIP